MKYISNPTSQPVLINFCFETIIGDGINTSANLTSVMERRDSKFSNLTEVYDVKQSKMMKSSLKRIFDLVVGSDRMDYGSHKMTSILTINGIRCQIRNDLNGNNVFQDFLRPDPHRTGICHRLYYYSFTFCLDSVCFGGTPP
jgi:hypothetical protein